MPWHRMDIAILTKKNESYKYCDRENENFGWTKRLITRESFGNSLWVRLSLVIIEWVIRLWLFVTSVGDICCKGGKLMVIWWACDGRRTMCTVVVIRIVLRPPYDVCDGRHTMNLSAFSVYEKQRMNVSKGVIRVAESYTGDTKTRSHPNLLFGWLLKYRVKFIVLALDIQGSWD